jgi:hypothetical protein
MDGTGLPLPGSLLGRLMARALGNPVMAPNWSMARRATLSASHGFAGRCSTPRAGGRPCGSREPGANHGAGAAGRAARATNVPREFLVERSACRWHAPPLHGSGTPAGLQWPRPHRPAALSRRLDRILILPASVSGRVRPADGGMDGRFASSPGPHRASAGDAAGRLGAGVLVARDEARARAALAESVACRATGTAGCRRGPSLQATSPAGG